MSKWTVEANADTIATIEHRYPVQFLPERTCRMEFSERKRGVYCSHCGERMDVYTCDQYGDGTMGYPYPFCCECGARVVE